LIPTFDGHKIGHSERTRTNILNRQFHQLIFLKEILKGAQVISADGQKSASSEGLYIAEVGHLRSDLYITLW